MKKFKKISLRIIIALAALYLLLLVPASENKDPVSTATNPAFTWNKDQLWQKLEKDYMAMMLLNTDSAMNVSRQKAEAQFAAIATKQQAVEDSDLDSLQQTFFTLATLVAVKPGNLQWYAGFYNRIRNYVKLQSQHWDMQQTIARNNVYRNLYGMRAAVEETILQSDSGYLPPAMMVKNEVSVTPAASLFGIEVHSGDILVSRGGAEVSALISRGNDYPGNFSHIALLYVDEKTNTPYLIESHIEKGVAIATAEAYEKDKKLRFMVMRPRADLAVMKANPMLPHMAARQVYEESFTRHIPYDFKMNFKDSSTMFCSEVASYAYRKQGLSLWPSLSTISSAGIVNWLHDFGVENFVTQMPSDLEYDPQLSVVAEWRDPETLYKDHLDNAVMDAMLEEANAGKKIEYNHWQLPFVRMVKGWCMIKNRFGKVGIIPEGMDATTALKNQWLVARTQQVTTEVKAAADSFRLQHKYRPPYWRLVAFARQAVLKH